MITRWALSTPEATVVAAVSGRPQSVSADDRISHVTMQPGYSKQHNIMQRVRSGLRRKLSLKSDSEEGEGGGQRASVDIDDQEIRELFAMFDKGENLGDYWILSVDHRGQISARDLESACTTLGLRLDREQLEKIIRV